MCNNPTDDVVVAKGEFIMSVAHLFMAVGGIIPIIILRWILKRFIFRKNVETVLRKSFLYSLVFIVSVILASIGVVADVKARLSAAIRERQSSRTGWVTEKS